MFKAFETEAEYKAHFEALLANQRGQFDVELKEKLGHQKKSHIEEIEGIFKAVGVNPADVSGVKSEKLTDLLLNLQKENTTKAKELEETKKALDGTNQAFESFKFDSEISLTIKDIEPKIAVDKPYLKELTISQMKQFVANNLKQGLINPNTKLPYTHAELGDKFLRDNNLYQEPTPPTTSGVRTSSPASGGANSSAKMELNGFKSKGELRAFAREKLAKGEKVENWAQVGQTEYQELMNKLPE